MNNFEKIKSMNEEEMIKFLLQYIDTSDIHPTYCECRCKKRVNMEEAEDCPYGICPSDEEILRDWMSMEVM